MMLEEYTLKTGTQVEYRNPVYATQSQCLGVAFKQKPNDFFNFFFFFG